MDSDSLAVGSVVRVSGCSRGLLASRAEAPVSGREQSMADKGVLLKAA